MKPSVRLPRQVHNWSVDPRTDDQLGRDLALQIEAQEQPIVEEWRRRVAENRKEIERLHRERAARIQQQSRRSS